LKLWFLLLHTNKLEMSNYLLHGKLKAKEGLGAPLSSVLLEASRALTAVKGCKLYLISADDTDNDSIWITEIWNSKEDHDNSLQIASVKSVISKALPILDGPPKKGQELEIIGGLGI